MDLNLLAGRLSASFPIMAERLRLIPMTESHITDELLGWLNDKTLMRYSRQRLFSHTRETSLAYLNTFAGTPNFYWAIERITDGQLVGSLNAYVNEHEGTADMGILIGHPEARGKGYGLEAWCQGLASLFGDDRLRKVTGGTNAENVAMARIFERSDMQLEGRRREQELLDGKPADVLLYGILRNEWEAGSS